MNTPDEPLRVPQDDVRGAEQLPDAATTINAFARLLVSAPGRLASTMQCLTCKGRGIRVCEHCEEGQQAQDRWDAGSEEHYTTQEACMECDGDYEIECDECGGEGVTEA